MAVDQSSLQTLIQQLGGTQTTAQQAVPFIANNGNPNTAYNVPSNPSVITPQSNAQGAWWTPPRPTYLDAPLSPVIQNLLGWYQQRPPVTAAPGGGVIAPGGGGGSGPSPGGPAGGTQFQPSGGPGGTPIGLPTDQLNQALAQGWLVGGSSPRGLQGIDINSPGIQQLAQSFGLSPGNFDWRQFLDVVSEPFVQGNFYDSVSGQWLPSNVATGAVNAVVPGLGSLLNMLAERGALGQWMQNQVQTDQAILDYSAIYGPNSPLSQGLQPATATSWLGSNPQIGGLTEPAAPYEPTGAILDRILQQQAGIGAVPGPALSAVSTPGTQGAVGANRMGQQNIGGGVTPVWTGAGYATPSYTGAEATPAGAAFAAMKYGALGRGTTATSKEDIANILLSRR